MFKLSLCAVAVVSVLVAPGPGRGAAAPSKVVAVTLYRGQALVTRTVTLPAESGELEVVVADLPAQVVSGSISASAAGAEGVSIRSVRYRTRAVRAAPQKEVAALDAKIKDVNRKVYTNGQMVSLLRATGQHLDKLEAFAAPTAQVELAKGVLDPKTLQQVSKYILQERLNLTRQGIRLHQEAEDLREELALLQRQRSALARGAGRSVREAVIFLSKADRGPARIRLEYLVSSARWTPAYNIRLGADGRDIGVEYLAEVSQLSGEDWSGVKLTLSTATPAMNAQSPLLVPMWVALTAPGKGKPGAVKSVADYAARQRTLLGGRYSAYIGGEFVGRGVLPLVARGQSCVIGLGVDTQLRCRRELLDKSDKIAWGSRVQEFRYQLRLENFKDKAVTVRLLDRIPATKTEELSIELGKLSHKLSSDPEYVRDLRPKGMLRWDIELPGGSAGAKALLVEYDFQMKFAKDAHVGREAAGLLKQMEEDSRRAVMQMMMH